MLAQPLYTSSTRTMQDNCMGIRDFFFTTDWADRDPKEWPPAFLELIYEAAYGRLPRRVIARDLNMSRRKVDEVLDHPNVQKEIMKVREDVKLKMGANLKDLAAKAVEIYEEILDSGRKEDNRLRAAKDILAGLGILTEKHEVDGTFTVIIPRENDPTYK